MRRIFKRPSPAGVQKSSVSLMQIFFCGLHVRNKNRILKELFIHNIAKPLTGFNVGGEMYPAYHAVKGGLVGVNHELGAFSRDQIGKYQSHNM